MSGPKPEIPTDKTELENRLASVRREMTRLVNKVRRSNRSLNNIKQHPNKKSDDKVIEKDVIQAYQKYLKIREDFIEVMELYKQAGAKEEKIKTVKTAPRKKH